MKYNTIATTAPSIEEKKSNFTIYAEMEKGGDCEAELKSARDELQIVQKALKKQTKRCQQLVAEYTRRLQQKELEYQNEKNLRDDQLAKVLRALLIFEARLRQEQKFITHQLAEKDYIIKKQRNDIKTLMSSQYCKKCNQFFRTSPNTESLDSSSEYVVTDYQDSNFESLDSSSETYYATLSGSEKNFDNADDNVKSEGETKRIYVKNKGKDSLGRRSRKILHRKSVGSYFEVLKIRNDSPCSNDDNTSNDYDNFDSLPTESLNDKISVVSERIENILEEETHNNGPKFDQDNDTSVISYSESNTTVINRNISHREDEVSENKADEESKMSKISDSIPVFEGDNESNDKWYASASDPEDEDQRNVYRNNPVLECMNQILLHNINDLNSPPKTPTVERKCLKNKRVKFSDEEDAKQPENYSIENNLDQNSEDKVSYYETPIQRAPNFYETPQSIYSNDYEQILSKCNETFCDSTNKNDDSQQEKRENHLYIDMDPKPEHEEGSKSIRKTKIQRIPPALPPKPANLVSKYKMPRPKSTPSEKSSLDSEPDYCSISELNLPTTKKSVSFRKISTVAEINPPNSLDVLTKLEKSSGSKISSDNSQSLVKKCVEKINIQVAKQTDISNKYPKKSEPEIPKLPQVSEIIIPEDDVKPDDRITQDNYIKNNTQILKTKTSQQARKPLPIGSSVSTLITDFNNKQILNELNKKDEKRKPNRLFSSFEANQNTDKQKPIDHFDLSQNFEEFKLDDCEIEEYTVSSDILEDDKSEEKAPITHVEIVRAMDDLMVPNLNRSSLELFMKQQLQKGNLPGSDKNKNEERSYEHFLECTGLSSKSILTPSRLISNHKSMLKPKDVKLRSKTKSYNIFEKNCNTTIRYWSEPYI